MLNDGPRPCQGEQRRLIVTGNLCRCPGKRPSKITGALARREAVGDLDWPGSAGMQREALEIAHISVRCAGGFPVSASAIAGKDEYRVSNGMR
jgi:hypothetical protein